MNPNEEIEQAADILHLHAADVAELLRGIVLNHPRPPVLMDPGANQPYEDEWYNAYGTPDFAYGKALKIARSVLAAAQTQKDINGLLRSDRPAERNDGEPPRFRPAGEQHEPAAYRAARSRGDFEGPPGVPVVFYPDGDPGGA